MSRTPTVSFANFICRFGDHLVLLDLASEVVLPAFGDKSLTRKYGDTRYFLLDAKIREFRAPRPNAIPLIGIYGRFVKDTVLTRTQIFLPGEGLVADEGSLASAPSAFFVLILNNHKLVYLPETPDAPSLDTFASTMQDFLRRKHREYVNTLYEQRRASGTPMTKKDLFQEYPLPDVAVLPLASKASIEQFVETFEKLMKLELQILDTNQELQMEETYRKLREMKHDIGASKTQLIHNNPAGLDKAQAMEQIHASAATGNQTVRLVGTAPDGTQVRGNNDDFKLQVPAREIPENLDERAAQMIEMYDHQIQLGILVSDVAEDEPEDVAPKIERLRRKLNE